jgi:hypothetical protein
VSPIATAQKQTEVHGIVQVAQVLLQIAGPEMAPQLLGKRVSVDRAIEYLWDIFNNDPKLLKTEEEAAAEEQQAQAAMAAQAAPQIAGAANQATGAVRNLSQANAQEGTDLGDLASRTLDQVRQNPRLLANLSRAANQPGIPPSSGPMQ